MNKIKNLEDIDVILIVWITTKIVLLAVFALIINLYFANTELTEQNKTLLENQYRLEQAIKEVTHE